MQATFDYRDGTVCMTRSGVPLGTLDSPEVKEILRAVGWEDMTDALRKRVHTVTYDYTVCPRCGSPRLHEQQEIDGVKFGFCAECMYTIHVDRAGRWHGYPERAPYRRSENKLAS